MRLIIDQLWATRPGPKAPGYHLHDTTRLRLRVLPGDVDLGRHMSNSRYLAYMDRGRFDLLRRSGVLDLMRPRGWYPVVAAQTISYRRALRPGRPFVLETRMLGYDDRSAFVEQRFVAGDETVAVGIVRNRILRRTGGVVPLHEIAAVADVDVDAHPAPRWVLDWADRSRAIFD
ncbi:MULTISPECIES: acyl-CoA thioesterase [Catenuloplanes]|uniref:YbgC/YbaW family acyl-CoA thioester hydrolase n=1 Tax=Catenuloplanes niger TaxID=587534 RepID=A0AAE3ZNE7_9ACTN|nr:acyl-CoA thioesterase [Catenuloplanes niger]MDR7321045.1 YbgC/YbaW family acyl-CoA thioester hydrolase [Catenuloplanes niger]